MSQPPPPPRPPPPTDSSFYSAASQLTSPTHESAVPPPLPPPKAPPQYTSGLHTPHSGPPLPPPPHGAPSPGAQTAQRPQTVHTQPPSVEEGWLPDVLRDKSKADLEAILQSPSLLSALLHAPRTTHPSLPESNAQLQNILSQNVAIANSLLALSNNLAHQRAEMTAKLLSLRALERQWHLKQSAMDDALSPFAPKAVHTRLVAGIQEQEGVLRAMEESFLEEEGKAGEREVADFLRRWKEGKKILVLRKERRERFEEGRVGGWR